MPARVASSRIRCSYKNARNPLTHKHLQRKRNLRKTWVVFRQAFQGAFALYALRSLGSQCAI